MLIDDDFLVCLHTLFQMCCTFIFDILTNIFCFLSASRKNVSFEKSSKTFLWIFHLFSPGGCCYDDERWMSHVKILSLSVRAIFLPCRLMNGKFSLSDGNDVHFWLGLRMNGFAVMWASAAFLSFTKKIKIDFRVWTSTEQVCKCSSFEGFAWLLAGAATRKHKQS